MPGVFGPDEFERGGYSTDSIGSNASIDRAVADDTFKKLSEDLPEVEALRYEHPDYKACKEKWLKYLNLYESKNIYKFIHKHLRESGESHKLRTKRGYYYNYCATVADLFTAFLYRAPVVRRWDKGLATKMSTFLANVDRRGTSFTSFMSKVCTFAQLQGHNAILVDAPSTGDVPNVLTAEDDKDPEVMPYLTHIYAHQIMDWSLDNYGNFDWVKLRIERPEPRAWNQTQSDVYETYQIWTSDRWDEYVVKGSSDNEADAEVEYIGGDTHDMGVVPLVVVCTDKSTHPWFGNSVIRDIADINIAILNWSSLQDEEIFNRALNVLVMEKDEDSRPINVSHYNVLEYPNGGQKPEYLVPGATPLEQIRASIADARDEIRRLAKMNISTGFSDVRQASSGIAHAFQFIEANQNLASKTLALQTAEFKVFKLVAKYLGEDSAKIEIDYAKEFGIEDYNMLLTEIAAMGETIFSETAEKEAQKDFARRRFNTADPEIIKKIEKEIDEYVKPDPLESFVSGFGNTGDGASDDAGSGKKPELVENQSPEPGEDPGPVTKTEE